MLAHERSEPSILRLLGTAAVTAGVVGGAWYADARARTRTAKRFRRVMVDVLLNALSAGDAFTERHSRRVANLTDALAAAYGFCGERKARLRVASLLHDMGKVDDRFFHILHSGRRLEPEERSRIEQHPHESAHILAPMERIYPGITGIVESHHESWDGGGYPRGVKGVEIPLEARIIAVADVFDALTQPRLYNKDPHTPEAALEALREGAGKHFDPSVVRRLERPGVLRAWKAIAAQGREAEREA